MSVAPFDINIAPSLRSIKVDMWLCKPNKQAISKLNDIHSIRYSLKLGKVNELSFTIPSLVERDHQLVQNPLIQKIKHRYLIKFKFNGRFEYLILSEHGKTVEDTESITYKAYGLGYQLADRDIRGYEAEAKSLTEIANEILSHSNWRVGYVDSIFDLKFRSHEIASQNLLQAIYDLAEKFNAIIVWDTVTLQINFYNPSSIGINQGLRFKPGKYLDSLNVTENSDEIVTRLRMYGQDGLTIRKLTPTGSNYIEDFSWYMHPFKQDDAGNVIQSSDYMSDELCIALIKYQKTLEQYSGQFESLNEMLLLKQEIILKKLQELSVIAKDLMTLLDELDIYNSSNVGNHADIVRRKTAKETEKIAKETEIEVLGSEEEIILNKIKAIQDATDISKMLGITLMQELNESYIIEKEFTNDTIIDEKDLLAEGIEAFNKLRVPSVSMDFNIVNFLSVVDSQYDWDKLVLGDTVLARHDRLDIDIKAKIIEINFDFDGDSIDLTVANEVDILTDHEKFLDKIYNANNTSNVVNMGKWKWGLIEETSSLVSKMFNDAINTVDQMVKAGYNQNITINERGIVVKSPQDPMSWLVIQNGMLAITNDRGISWKHAITKDGIIGERIIGKILMGNRLIIEDEDGIIRLSGNKQEIFDSEGNVKITLGKYDTDKYGLKIDDGAIDLSTSKLPNSGLKLDKNGMRAFSPNGIKTFEVDSATGTTSIFGSLDIRTSTTSGKGVVINSSGLIGYKSNGTEAFRLDNLGNATFSGNLSGATGTFSGNLSAAGGTFSGDISAATGSFGGSLRAATGTFSGDLVAAGGTFSGALSAATGTFSGNLSAATLSGVNIVGATITGGTVKVSGGTLDLSQGNIIWGTNIPQAYYAVNAGNANMLNGMYTASDFSKNGHTHSDTEYVKPYTGQYIRIWVGGGKARIYNGSNFMEFTPTATG